MKEEIRKDVIIVGGGIAGMTAAIYAARANLTTAIIEKEVCGGLVNSTHVVENYPSYTSINGMELMENVLDQTEKLGVEVQQVAEIHNMQLTEDVKEIETDDAIYRARSVILATGRVPVSIGIESELEQIHYCSVCDGATYKDKTVVVVGGGNSGFDESLYLLSLGVKKIVLLEMMDRFFASASTQDKLKGNEKFEARTSTRIKEIVGEQKLTSVVVENLTDGSTEEIQTDGIFVFIGQKPNTKAFEDVIDLDKQGYILANENMETNIPGVFAAGDVNQKQWRQITTAMADGTIAALNAESYLRG